MGGPWEIDYKYVTRKIGALQALYSLNAEQMSSILRALLPKYAIRIEGKKTARLVTNASSSHYER